MCWNILRCSNPPSERARRAKRLISSGGDGSPFMTSLLGRVARRVAFLASSDPPAIAEQRVSLGLKGPARNSNLNASRDGQALPCYAKSKLQSLLHFITCFALPGVPGRPTLKMDGRGRQKSAGARAIEYATAGHRRARTALQNQRSSRAVSTSQSVGDHRPDRGSSPQAPGRGASSRNTRRLSIR